MALTDTEIKQAKPASKPYTLTDGDGLSLQVPTTGSQCGTVNTLLHACMRWGQMRLQPGHYC